MINVLASRRSPGVSVNTCYKLIVRLVDALAMCMTMYVCICVIYKCIIAQ